MSIRPSPIYDDEGVICKLAPQTPGVLYDADTGTPMQRFTEKWYGAVRRLYALEGVQDDLDDADRTEEGEHDRG